MKIIRQQKRVRVRHTSTIGHTGRPTDIQVEYLLLSFVVTRTTRDK